MFNYGTCSLSRDQIRSIDQRGGDLIASLESGKYDKATCDRIRAYLDRPCDPAPNGSGEVY